MGVCPAGCVYVCVCVYVVRMFACVYVIICVCVHYVMYVCVYVCLVLVVCMVKCVWVLSLMYA